MTAEPCLVNPFAAEIKRLLGEGMTQTQIAEKVGVSQAIVSEWAAGNKLPGAARLPLLVAIGVSRAAYENARIQKILCPGGDNL
jgi:transcriptional regulator with XRE-family HTH domain